MLDTLDKGKKAYDGEAGEFFFEYRSVCLMVGNKKIKFLENDPKKKRSLESQREREKPSEKTADGPDEEK